MNSIMNFFRPQNNSFIPSPSSNNCDCGDEYQFLCNLLKSKFTDSQIKPIIACISEFVAENHDCEMFDDVSLNMNSAIEISQPGNIKPILHACIVANVIKNNSSTTTVDPFLGNKISSLEKELFQFDSTFLYCLLERQQQSNENEYSHLLQRFRHLYNFLMYCLVDPSLIRDDKLSTEDLWWKIKRAWLQKNLERFNGNKSSTLDNLMEESDTARHFMNVDARLLERFIKSLPISTNLKDIQLFFNDYIESKVSLVRFELLLQDPQHMTMKEKHLTLKVEICSSLFAKNLPKNITTSRIVDLTRPLLRNLLKSWPIYELKKHVLLVRRPEDAVPMKDCLQLLIEFHADPEACSFNLGNLKSSQWVKAVHQSLVNKYFSKPSNELSIEEVIDQVFIKDEQGEIEMRKSELTEIFETVQAEYAIISDQNLEAVKTLITQNLPSNWCKRLAYILRIANLHFKVSFRPVQILAIILAHFKPSHRSRVLQINTGEGKTYIIAILAVLKALDHHKVDIITSSSELAELQSKKLAPFYELFNLSTANNRSNDFSVQDILRLFGGGRPRPYECNIVYGEVSDFQGDILRDEFQKSGEKCGRQCDFAIVDEVDSMMIDRSLNFVYLAEKVPGMFHLLHILGAIWTQIQHISNAVEERNGRFYFKDPAVGETLRQDAENYRIDEPIRSFYKRCTTDYIKCLLRLQTPSEENFPQLRYPNFLKSLVKVQLPRWISSGISAKLDMRLGYEYVLHQDKITIVDANRTGVLEFSMTWSNGLHQFLQMKHGCQITSENLTTNFISNVTYLQRYGTNLIGLTGTIGGASDRKLLREAYTTDCVVLPPYREARHVQLYPLIGLDRTDWLNKVAENVFKKLCNGQAALVITNYIQEADDIAKLLTLKGSTVHKYTRNSESSVTQKVLEPGEVIVATNIAGRGTDILVNDDVEKSGGLHVCVTFLPENFRVERQNVGRTSRTGNSGTSQFIVLQENSNLEASEALRELRKNRDTYVMACVNQALQQITVAQQKDRIFKRFCDLKDRIEKSVSVETNKFIQEALNEKFGHWLLRMDDGDIQIKDFEQFEAACLNNPEDNIIENSFIFVKMANESIKSKNYDQAITYLTKAIKIDPELAANAYYLRGYVKVIKYNTDTKKRSMIDSAIQDMKKARSILEEQHQSNINMIAPELTDGSIQLRDQLGRYKTLFGTIVNSIHAAVGQEVESEIDELEKALESNEIEEEQRKQLQERRNHLVENRKSLEDGALITARRNGRQVTIKKLEFEKALPPDERKELYKDAIKEINLNGFYTVYVFNEKTPINWGAVIGVGLLGIGQLVAGAATALFSVGVGIGIGYSLIQEGVCDLIAAVKDGIINRNFSWAKWGIQKAISLAITVACAGFAALKSAASGAVRGMKVAANAAKEGVKTTAKAAFKSCAKLIGIEVAKGATKEIIAPFVGYALSNTVEEPLKNMLTDAVNNAVTSYLQFDSNVTKLIEADRKNRNFKYAKKLEEKLLSFLDKDVDTYREFGRDIMRRLEGRVGGLTGQIFNFLSQGAKYQEILTIVNEVMSHLPSYVKEIADSKECQEDLQKEEKLPEDDSMVRVKAINVTLDDFCQHISNRISTVITAFAMGAFVQKISSSCVNSAFKSVSNHVNQEVEKFRENYGGIHGDFEELDTKMDRRLGVYAMKLEENIAVIENGGPASAVHVESLAHSINRQIIVIDGTETIIFGEGNTDSEAIVLKYERNGEGEIGHYTLANGKAVTQSGENSCLFDAVAVETGLSADQLRKGTASVMVHNYRAFAEVELGHRDTTIRGGKASDSAWKHTYSPDRINSYGDDEESESCERGALDLSQQQVEIKRTGNKIITLPTKGQPRTTLIVDPSRFDNEMQKEYDRVFNNLLKAGQVTESQRSTHKIDIRIKGKVKGCERIATQTKGNSKIQLSSQDWKWFENPTFVVKGGKAVHYKHQHTKITARVPTRDGGSRTGYDSKNLQYEYVP